MTQNYFSPHLWGPYKIDESVFFIIKLLAMLNGLCIQLYLVFSICFGAKARTLADDDMVFIGSYKSIGFSSHLIHDVFDEAMFYEFLQSNEAVTIQNLKAYINRTRGTFGNLSDQQFDSIVSKWIFQMLPGGLGMGRFWSSIPKKWKKN